MAIIKAFVTNELGWYQGLQDLEVHDPSACYGKHCCIHYPSSHHMVSWKQLWRADRHRMERLCLLHGVSHPDPDDLSTDRMHDCCGCCQPPKED